MSDQASANPEIPAQQQPQQQAAAAQEPQRFQHSERIIRVAQELGIDPTKAESMDSAALRQEIADAQLEMQIRQSRRGQPVQQQVQQVAAVPEPEEEFVVPPELRVKLAQSDPAIVELVNLVGKEAVKSRRTQAELARLRQEQVVRDLEHRVDAVISTLPNNGGSNSSRSRAIKAELGALENAGELNGLSVEQAVHLAHRNLFGGTTSPSSVSPPPPPPPARPAATPTARPTNRMEPALQGRLDRLDGNTAEDFVP